MASFTNRKSDFTDSFAILPRIALADKTAIQECIDIYGNMIWALAKQFTASAADAEKVVPEIFKDIWQNAAFCDLEISEEAVWIALLARRRLSKYAPDNLHRQSAQLPNEILKVETDKAKKNNLAA